MFEIGKNCYVSEGIYCHFTFSQKRLIKQTVNITAIIEAKEYLWYQRHNKILSYKLPLMLIQDADKNIEYLQCSFRREIRPVVKYSPLIRY
jgi:hypothetical protein